MGWELVAIGVAAVGAVALLYRWRKKGHDEDERLIGKLTAEAEANAEADQAEERARRARLRPVTTADVRDEADRRRARRAAGSSDGS